MMKSRTHSPASPATVSRDLKIHCELLAVHPLGIPAAAEMDTYFAARSTDIAVHMGFSPAYIHGLHESNRAYWDHLERRWIDETFDPLAPVYEVERQARADRQKWRDARNAARREAWAKGQAQETRQQRPAVPMVPRPAAWQWATVALVDFVRQFVGGAKFWKLLAYWFLLAVAAWFLLRALP